MANILDVLVSTLILLPLSANAISVHYAHRFGGKIDDLQGPYCAGRKWGSTGSRWWAGGRSSVCCNGRYDDCSVPILGTLCYCDQFCDRGVTHDCCPDYWDVCVGAPPPPISTPETIIRKDCIYNGKLVREGESVKENCNTCTCSSATNAPSTMICTRNKCLLDSSLSSALRRESYLGWTPINLPSEQSIYNEFWGRTLDDGLRLRLGTVDPEDSVMGMQKVQFHINDSIPLIFDGRRTWREMSSPPLDQGWCASSWALSAATVISDRAIIADNTVKPLIYEHLLECRTRSRHPVDKCSAGHLHRIWKLLSDYGAPEKECTDREGPSERECRPKPRNRCRRQRSGPAYRLGDIPRMQDNIRWYGPVQATMRVYHDFFHYKSGVYSRPIGSDDRESYGYHSVRIIGWGEDNSDPRRPVPYWLVANSWGTWWGEGGYFRIKKGVNECDIEKYVLGAWIQPELARSRVRRS